MRPMMRNGLVYGRRKENSGTDESLERIGRWLMRRGRVGEFRHGEGKRRRLERSSDARSFPTNRVHLQQPHTIFFLIAPGPITGPLACRDLLLRQSIARETARPPRMSLTASGPEAPAQGNDKAEVWGIKKKFCEPDDEPGSEARSLSTSASHMLSPMRALLYWAS